jgi:hypothetical protein
VPPLIRRPYLDTGTGKAAGKRFIAQGMFAHTVNNMHYGTGGRGDISFSGRAGGPPPQKKFNPVIHGKPINGNFGGCLKTLFGRIIHALLYYLFKCSCNHVILNF